jgi:hypothetical protein
MIALKPMILAKLYNAVGYLLMILGGLGIVLGVTNQEYFFMPSSFGAIVAGLFCLGLGEICSAIGKIAEQTKRTADLLFQRESSDTKGVALTNMSNLSNILTATNQTVKLLEKIAAVSAPTPSPVQKIKGETAKETGTQYYFSDAQMQPQGPYSAAVIRKLAAEGRIQHDTPIAQAGSDDWLPFGESPYFSSTPQP